MLLRVPESIGGRRPPTPTSQVPFIPSSIIDYLCKPNEDCESAHWGALLEFDLEAIGYYRRHVCLAFVKARFHL